MVVLRNMPGPLAAVHYGVCNVAKPLLTASCLGLPHAACNQLVSLRGFTTGSARCDGHAIMPYT